MVVVFAEVCQDASPSLIAPSAVRWQPLRMHTKATLPIENYSVVAGQCKSDPTRQVTAIGGHVKATSHRLLVVLPFLAASPATTNSPAIQILEVGESAVQFLTDVKACFPTLVRKSPMADDDEEANSEGDSDDSDGNAKRQPQNPHGATSTDTSSKASTLAVAAYQAQTRVRVLPSLDALREAYPFDMDATQSTMLTQHDSPHASIFLCIELPPHPAPSPVSAASSTLSDPKPLHFGVVFIHNLNPQALDFLQIPLLRHLPRPPQQDQEDKEDQVFVDATVWTFNSKRESSEHGGGKTADETVHNIRLRHASGTFCTLVLPHTSWDQVARKHSAMVPQVGELHGQLRCRKFIGTIPNRPVTISLLETK